MKKSPASLLLSTLLLLVVFITGCSSAPDGVHPAYARHNNGVNALGIVDYQPNSYDKLKDNNFNVHTSELTDVPDPSGDNLSLLWGLIVIADY